MTAESNGDAPGRNRLIGRKILVVGGGQRVFDATTDPIGNGRAMSLLYAKEGAHVAVADLHVQSARSTVETITNQGGAAFAIEADVTQATSVAEMINSAHSQMGGLDGMVINAGIFGTTSKLKDVDVDEWDQSLAVNLRGPLLCCKYAMDKLDDGSSIIFISSIAALIAGSRIASYDSSKAGLHGLLRHTALEGARRGIRVNLVYPGLVDTPNGRAAGAGRKNRAATPIPFGRMTTGWEVAYATLFFMSDESVYITAQTLAVDSGMTGL